MPKVRDEFEAQHIRLAKQQLAQINDWRRNESDLPSKAEAIRRLLDLGLAASQSSLSGLLSGASEEQLVAIRAELKKSDT
jgi:hypothetical protein